MGQAKSQISNQKMVHVRLEPELHRRLRIVVASEDTSIQDWLSDAVERAVEKAWPTITQGTNKK